MKIDDITFFRFVNNLLGKDDMASVAKSLRESGEADAALHASVAGYCAKMALADEMLGADTEIADCEKNLLAEDRMFAAGNSVEANKTSQKIMKANLNITKDELKYVHAIVENFNNSSVNGEDISIEEKLVKFYLGQCTGAFPEDAYKLVEEMRHGIETFNANLQKALSESGFDYAAELAKLAADMPLKEKYELYANFLAALQTLAAANMSPEQLSLIDDFQTVRGKLSVEGEVNEDTLAELEARIADMLANNTLCMGSLDQLRHLIGELPKGAEAVGQATRDAEEDMRQKLIASVATYIAYSSGNIASMRDKEYSAESIAIAVAAGVEQANVVADLEAGRTTPDRAIRVLKIVGGVALFSLLAYSAFSLMMLANSAVAACVTCVFGTSAMATLGAFAAIAVVSLGMGEALVWAGEKVIGFASRTFDLIVDTWRTVAYPFVASSAERAWLWLKEQLCGGTLRQEGAVEESVQTVAG